PVELGARSLEDPDGCVGDGGADAVPGDERDVELLGHCEVRECYGSTTRSAMRAASVATTSAPPAANTSALHTTLRIRVSAMTRRSTASAPFPRNSTGISAYRVSPSAVMMRRLSATNCGNASPGLGSWLRQRPAPSEFGSDRSVGLRRALRTTSP